MRVLPLAAALLLAACAEMTRPPPPEPPVELAGGLVAQPLLSVLNHAVSDFDRAGAGLEGHPEHTALAIARLEWLGGETRPGHRLENIPDSFLFGLRRGVQEGRQALAIAPDASPDTTVPALLAASRALTNGDVPAASRALTGPDFRDTDRPAMSRLREPGPFPDTALTLPALRDEVVRRQSDGRINQRVSSEFMDSGVTTSGMGGRTDR
ncbi:hypothetical protein [Roseococcus pinisoli]|uniref:Lipoprotein n=1 Tax=Roseococcus pinisoli TaxID=2835040 RepID=A0ABS5QE08_9PROT|nr:hypothetical protein [Roseococcus pinisoli]MBS7811934.1 hypothetical protein [Roseococcus pinisoli]